MLTSLSELPLPSLLPVIPLRPVKNIPHAINRSTTSFTQEELALIKLGRRLRQADYHFITVTPDTHRLVNARSANESARDVRDIFGWNRPFSYHVLPQSMWNDLQNTAVFEQLEDGRFRSRVRFSTIDEQLILHSGFPTVTQDAVFFGPDTYRFVQHLRRFVGAGSALLEIGAGTGAAALCFGERFKHLVMTDINPRAVRCARINAALAGYTQAEVVCADIAGAMTGSFDAIIANPPYMIDPHKRWYRDGGCLGIALTLRMVLGALPLLAPGGRLVFYTGSPVIAGEDRLKAALIPLLTKAGLQCQYEELEVDVFGSDMNDPAYAEIERIAVVGIVAGTSPTMTAVRLSSAGSHI